MVITDPTPTTSSAFEPRFPKIVKTAVFDRSQVEEVEKWLKRAEDLSLELSMVSF